MDFDKVSILQQKKQVNIVIWITREGSRDKEVKTNKKTHILKVLDVYILRCLKYLLLTGNNTGYSVTFSNRGHIPQIYVFTSEINLRYE